MTDGQLNNPLPPQTPPIPSKNQHPKKQVNKHNHDKKIECKCAIYDFPKPGRLFDTAQTTLGSGI